MKNQRLLSLFKLFALLLLVTLLGMPSGQLIAQTTPAPSSSALNLPGTTGKAVVAPAGQQDSESNGSDMGSTGPNMITQASAIIFMSLVPYLVILLTAFIKVSVVLSLLRNALGLQQSPPNQVINGLALILSLYVMFPTGVAMYNAAKKTIDGPVPTEIISKESSAFIIHVVDVAKNPLRDFLIKNTSAKHLKSFYQIAQKMVPDSYKSNIKETDFLVVIPSYITSQLKDAYEIGVLIYLPFFVIDLVVSNILLAMGMMMLSPLTIALPLKLLLLVMLDGWTLLIQGLILTFK